MFVENLNGELMSQIQIQCCTTFEEIIEKGVLIEKGPIARGLVKINKETPKPNNDKGKYWSQNKNVTNDEVVDAKLITKGQIIQLKGSLSSSTSSTPSTPT